MKDNSFESILGGILENYRALCSYCDSFFNAALKKYQKHVFCKASCSMCCELESVNYLEAFIIISRITTEKQKNNRTESKCIFLIDDNCSIYSSRPIICRTHGLALSSSEFSAPYAISCPLNFQSPSLHLDSHFILDSDTVTLNLIKLNLAFCLLLGDCEQGSKRVSLEEIAAGKRPEIFRKIRNYDAVSPLQ
ncbi:MAG: YkgJ family cysteine cluster protein [Fibrobacter sp.]|nr:YkgJ family cysteine cluster protein [Fibrobacter sp.]